MQGWVSSLAETRTLKFYCDWQIFEEKREDWCPFAWGYGFIYQLPYILLRRYRGSTRLTGESSSCRSQRCTDHTITSDVIYPQYGINHTHPRSAHLAWHSYCQCMRISGGSWPWPRDMTGPAPPQPDTDRRSGIRSRIKFDSVEDMAGFLTVLVLDDWLSAVEPRSPKTHSDSRTPTLKTWVPRSSNNIRLMALQRSQEPTALFLFQSEGGRSIRSINHVMWMYQWSHFYSNLKLQPTT
jgi:hypothetical protein